MRRSASIAAFVLVLSLSLWAQRGGGGHGGGGHGGFGGGGHAGFGGGHIGGFGGHVGGGSFAGGHFSGGPRGVSGFHGGNGFVHSNHFGSRGPFLHDGFRQERFHTFGFRNNCFGWRCGWGWSPWWGAAYYDPWWWWNQDDQQFDNDYYRQYQIANEMNQQSLEQQRMWRQEEADGDQDAYAPQRPNADPAPNPQGPDTSTDSNDPPTVLVFRNGQREETQNYAIVGAMLWSFTRERTQKIALARLDLAATEKVNLERGVDFHIPEPNPEPDVQQ
jgi:hypothetical protein